MAISMTGYGREKTIINGYDISVEIKSVNNRYFDANIRVPKAFSFLEEKVRKHLSKRINRGKTDVFIYMKSVEDSEFEICVNHQNAQAYYNVYKELADKFDMIVKTVDIDKFRCYHLEKQVRVNVIDLFNNNDFLNQRFRTANKADSHACREDFRK